MTTISLRDVMAGLPGSPADAQRRARLRAVLVALVVLALLMATGVVLLLAERSSKRTVTAYFTQAVSVFPGTDVDIMGVPVGKVTSIQPEGTKVKVVMQYDDAYSLPADVKAAVVTPTLIADRFIQLAPAYTGGPALADGGTIPLSRTAVPVEMDDIYRSLSRLTTALGPNGANRKGALSRLLESSANALRGNGRLGNELIANLSQAMRTLGDDSGPLFKTLDGLAAVTETLGRNDATVQRFLTRLAGVSRELSGESGDLRQALTAIANAVTITKGFVHKNKSALVGDVHGLNTTLGVLAKDQKTLGTVLQLAPLGLGNLALAWDATTGTEGIRLQVGPTASDLANILCDLVTNDKIPSAGAVCTLFKALIPSQLTSDVGAGLSGYQVPPGTIPTTPAAPAPTKGPTSAPSPAGGLGGLIGTVQGLLGGGK